MKTYDVHVTAKLIIRADANSAEDAVYYVNDAFNTTRGRDALQGVKFAVDYAAIEEAMPCEIATCTIENPEDTTAQEA